MPSFRLQLPIRQTRSVKRSDRTETRLLRLPFQSEAQANIAPSKTPAFGMPLTAPCPARRVAIRRRETRQRIEQRHARFRWLRSLPAWRRLCMDLLSTAILGSNQPRRCIGKRCKPTACNSPKRCVRHRGKFHQRHLGRFRNRSLPLQFLGL